MERNTYPSSPLSHLSSLRKAAEFISQYASPLLILLGHSPAITGPDLEDPARADGGGLAHPAK